MTKIIGLTGGIGSGKSTIAAHFKSLGIPVYIADDASKALLDEPKITAQLLAAFGPEVFENIKPDRQKLARLVFSNPAQLQRLNAIMHPAVKADFESWLAQHAKFPLIIKEAAILFESGSYTDCDKIITVTAPLEKRIERVSKRDGISREKVLERVNNQWTDAQRIAKSDFVIDNTNLESAKAEATEILKKLTIQ